MWLTYRHFSCMHEQLVFKHDMHLVLLEFNVCQASGISKFQLLNCVWESTHINEVHGTNYALSNAHLSNNWAWLSNCHNENGISLTNAVFRPLGSSVVTLVQHHAVDVLLLVQPRRQAKLVDTVRCKIWYISNKRKKAKYNHLTNLQYDSRKKGVKVYSHDKKSKYDNNRKNKVKKKIIDTHMFRYLNRVFMHIKY